MMPFIEVPLLRTRRRRAADPSCAGAILQLARDQRYLEL
jgi:hypothetical protein